ncbi:MAG: hypothetical protein QW503_02255 [Sulfolobales archaeon]
MNPTGVKRRLREYKALAIARLHAIEKELKEKYPDKAERVSEVVGELLKKIYDLRTRTLSDYLMHLYKLSREFPELSRLIPDETTVKEILEEA